MAPATAAQDPDANVSYLVYIPAAVFLAVCPILVGLRIYARIRGGARVGADDYMAIVSLVRLNILRIFEYFGQSSNILADLYTSSEWLSCGWYVHALSLKPRLRSTNTNA